MHQAQSALDLSILNPSDTFAHRHIGPTDADVRQMLQTLGVESLEQLIDQTVPAALRFSGSLGIGPPRGEHELLEELRGIAAKNTVLRSCLGMGYSDTITP